MSRHVDSIEPMLSHELVRWARQERSALIGSYLQSAAIYVANSLSDCMRYFAKLVRSAAHEMYLWNAARTLHQFDDRAATCRPIHLAQDES